MTRGNGHSRAERAAVAARRAKLVQYRLDGRQYDEFWEELGYSSRYAATKDFARALEENIAAQHEGVEIWREIEIQRLDAEVARLTRLYGRVEKLLDRERVVIQFGKVVYLDGSTIPDDAPFLQVVDRLMRIDEQRRRNSERRAKLLGLDAPQRTEVVTIDAINAEIQRLSDGLGMPNPLGAGETRTAADPAGAEG